MEQINKIHAWKQTKTGLIVAGTIELILAYILGSLAIDSGSYWHYLLAFIFFIGFVHSLVKAFKSYGRK